MVNHTFLYGLEILLCLWVNYSICLLATLLFESDFLLLIISKAGCVIHINLLEKPPFNGDLVLSLNVIKMIGLNQTCARLPVSRFCPLVSNLKDLMANLLFSYIFYGKFALLILKYLPRFLY